jgi:plastocyanin
VSVATPENLTPAATATAAAPTSTPKPASEAVTPIAQQTNPTPAGNTPPAPATPTPTPPPAAGNPASASVGVSGVRSYFWSPANVAIAPGGSVTWSWSGDVFHDVVVEGLGYSSGDPVKAGSYTLTFPSSGTYAVSCSIHPDTMRGTVKVE